MDRQWISTPSLAGSNPAGGAKMHYFYLLLRGVNGSWDLLRVS